MFNLISWPLRCVLFTTLALLPLLCTGATISASSTSSGKLSTTNTTAFLGETYKPSIVMTTTGGDPTALTGQLCARYIVTDGRSYYFCMDITSAREQTLGYQLNGVSGTSGISPVINGELTYSYTGNTPITIHLNVHTALTTATFGDVETTVVATSTSMAVADTCALTLTSGCSIGTTPSTGVVSLIPSHNDGQGRGTLIDDISIFKYALMSNGTPVSLSSGTSPVPANSELTLESVDNDKATSGTYTGNITVTLTVP